MSKKFEEAVDKFDKGELTGMDDDERIIEEIASAASVIGERQLRSNLIRMQKEHKKERTTRLVYFAIAASVAFVLGAFFVFRSEAEKSSFRKLQMEQAPTYMDSALYKKDSVMRDSLKNDITLEINE